MGALAGRDALMEVLDPSKDRLPFPHSGTFSANPVTMTAGLAAMELFDHDAVTSLNELGDFARSVVTQAIDETGIEACVTGAGSMFRVHLLAGPPLEYRTNYQDADTVAEIRFLVDYLYDHGFMMINTCSAALSTVTPRSEIERFGDVFASALRALLERRAG